MTATVPQTPAAPLAELVRVPCPNCEQGAILINQGTWTEQYASCVNPNCQGGWVEVCPGCSMTPDALTDECGCPSSKPMYNRSVLAGVQTPRTRTYKEVKVKDNLLGCRFGRLVVISSLPFERGRTRWLCKCDCGTEKMIVGKSLKEGRTKSCGCLKRESMLKRAADKVEDLSGQVFGRLTVTGRAKSKNGRVAWRCRCVCGTEKIFTSNVLKQKNTQSCGCLHKELLSQRASTHRASGTKEYRAWNYMKTRCANPNTKHWEHYGGRGIRVCDRWLEAFENFYADVGPAPTEEHSIDRVEVEGNYEPGNVRWAVPKIQAQNRRGALLVKYQGEILNLSELANNLGLSYYSLRYHHVLLKVPIDAAVKKACHAK